MDSEHPSEIGTLLARMGVSWELWVKITQRDVNPASQSTEYFLTVSNVWHVLSHGRFYERITAEYLCLQKWQDKTEKWKRKETRTWASSVDTNTPRVLCCRHVEWWDPPWRGSATQLKDGTQMTESPSSPPTWDAKSPLHCQSKR